MGVISALIARSLFSARRSSYRSWARALRAERVSTLLVSLDAMYWLFAPPCSDRFFLFPKNHGTKANVLMESTQNDGTHLVSGLPRSQLFIFSFWLYRFREHQFANLLNKIVYSCLVESLDFLL